MQPTALQKKKKSTGIEIKETWILVANFEMQCDLDKLPEQSEFLSGKTRI